MIVRRVQRYLRDLVQVIGRDLLLQRNAQHIFVRLALEPLLGERVVSDVRVHRLAVLLVDQRNTV